MRKTVTLLVILNLFQHLGFAQNSTIDSLKKLIANTSVDTIKVNALYNMGWELSATNPDSAIAVDKQALQLAEKKQWKNGMAKLYDDIGTYYNNKGEYPLAIDNTNKAITFYEETSDKIHVAAMFGNLGLFYMNEGDYPKALEYDLKTLKMADDLGRKKLQGNTLGNIGILYQDEKNYPKALEYYFKALKLAEEIGMKGLQGNSLSNIGLVYQEQKDYPKALEYDFKTLKIAEEIGDKYLQGNTLGNIGIVYYFQNDISKALEYDFKALKMAEDIGYKPLQAITRNNIGNHYMESGKFKEAEEYLKQAIAMGDSLGYKKELVGFEKDMSHLYDTTGIPNLALQHYKRATVLKDSLFDAEKDKEITRKAMTYEFDKKETIAKAEQEKKDVHQKNIRNSISASLAGALVFLIVVYRQRNKIKAGKKISDELLLNILPNEVAEELKISGQAEAKLFDHVTVLFTDFVGFTLVSEKLTPKELVAEIHTYFTAFDKIMELHGLEKIKTIGDAYLAVCGLPHPSKDHAKRTVLAALDIVQFINHHETQGGKFNIRVGINSGSVVAGIVGVKKFAYDIWGDTVNTAARMEQNSKNGKINISESTYQLVKNDFKCEHRGKIAAKNKGEVDMYFVEGKI